MFKKIFNNFYHLFPKFFILKHQLDAENQSYTKDLINGLPSFVRSNYIKHLNDKKFLKNYNLVKDYTIIDVLRLYELWYLVNQTKKLELGCYLEIGIFKGGSGLLIAKAIENFNISSKLYLADTFQGVVKTSVKDSNYKGGEHFYNDRSNIENLFNKNNINNFNILSGVFPEDTGKYIKEKIRIIHIDVDAYRGAKDIVEWGYNKLVNNGIIVFDDYGFVGCDGVIKLCEEYEDDSRFIFFHNINGHCVLIKKDN